MNMANANVLFEIYLKSLINNKYDFIYEVNHLYADSLNPIRQFFRDHKDVYGMFGGYDRESISNVIKNTAIAIGVQISDEAVKKIVKNLRRAKKEQ